MVHLFKHILLTSPFTKQSDERVRMRQPGTVKSNLYFIVITLTLNVIQLKINLVCFMIIHMTHDTSNKLENFIKKYKYIET